MSEFEIVLSIVISAWAITLFFLRRTQRLGFALWVLSLLIGTRYLVSGAEILGLMQILIGTVSGVALFFYGVAFEVDQSVLNRGRALAALVLSAAFFSVVFLFRPESALKASSLSDEWVVAGVITAFSVVLIIIGSGLMSRPEKRGD